MKGDEFDELFNYILRFFKLMIYGLLGLLVWVMIQCSLSENPKEVSETNRMMVYKYKIIHCDGRERVIVQERTEKNPPSNKSIRAYSSSGYIPEFEGFYNVCDIEVLEVKIK